MKGSLISVVLDVIDTGRMFYQGRGSDEDRHQDSGALLVENRTGRKCPQLPENLQESPQDGSKATARLEAAVKAAAEEDEEEETTEEGGEKAAVSVENELLRVRFSRPSRIRSRRLRT